MPTTKDPLQIKTPTPSDLDIAQSVDPVHISEIAAEIGILPNELDLYGPNKAKVIQSFVF